MTEFENWVLMTILELLFQIFKKGIKVDSISFSLLLA